MAPVPALGQDLDLVLAPAQDLGLVRARGQETAAAMEDHQVALLLFTDNVVEMDTRDRPHALRELARPPMSGTRSVSHK